MTDTPTPDGGRYVRAALRAHAAGLAVLPPEQDGSKAPLAGGWKRYQHERPDEATIRAWYVNGRTGIGAVMGAVSGNVELFEFDDSDTYTAYKLAAHTAGLGDLVERVEQGYSEQTPGGGVHWYYRCPEISGNTRLAKRPRRADEMRHATDRWKVLIETKGEGGYSIMAPSNGSVHPTGRAYTRLAGRPATIVTLTPEERRELWTLARTFDETPERAAPPEMALTGAEKAVGRPGDEYAARTAWSAILEPHGWRRVYERAGVTYWRRPGKDRGISASTGYKGSDLLYVWTSSTAFEPDTSYTKLGAYAVLNHGGDYGAAARELRRQGYGDERGAASVVLEADEPAVTVDPATGEVKGGRYQLIDFVDYQDRPPPRWLVDGVLPEGAFACIVGQPGAGKSFLALEITFCIATGTPFYNRAVRRGRVLYIVGEGQAGFSLRIKAWQKARGVRLDRGNAVLIPGVVPLIDHTEVTALVAQIRALGLDFDLVVIDTLSRAMPGADENSPKDMTNAVEAAGILQRELGTAVMPLHHGTKADGTIRGHSSLPGALDTIIKVTADANRRIAVICEKQKDGGEPFEKLLLKQTSVDLSDSTPEPETNEHANEISVMVAHTSLVLDPLGEAEQREAAERRDNLTLTNGQLTVLRTLLRLDTPALHTEWWEACKQAGMRSDQARSFRYIRTALISKGMVLMDNSIGIERYTPTDQARVLIGAPGAEE